MPVKIYPWEKWLSRRRVVLLRGRDYSCSTSAMAQQVRNNASLMSVSVSVEEVEAGLIVSVSSPRKQGAV